MAIVVQGDTRPVIRANLYEKDSNPKTYINLTSCSVKFLMRKADDKWMTVSGSASITSTASGGVQYQLGANDLNIPGEYLVFWQVTYPDAKVQTTSVGNPITVRRA
jgi:hypothetical protein